jgi:hypothetical protein
LNHALSELGLSLMDRDEIAMAVECLGMSSRVHPCPHNMSFGLSTRLWSALAGIPEAEDARKEYETVARGFAAGFGAID